MQFVGMDTHKEFSQVCVMDESGSVLYNERVANTPESIDGLVSRLEPGCKVVMEASSCWQYLYDYLEEHGFDMSLANPLQVKAIASARVKTDKIDAETLAHLLRADLIPESYVPPQLVRDERQVVRLRASLVDIRTQLKNKVHAVLARQGIKHSFSDLFGKSGTAFLQTLELAPASRFELDEYLTLLAALDERVDHVQTQVVAMAEDNYSARRLMTIPGISYYSALTVMSEIGDFTRFADAKHLCSYAGLVPSVYQSGNTRRTGHITKQGSKWLRWILIQSANRAVMQNNALHSFYLELKQRKGHNTAIVATARKLLVYIYTMLKLNLSFNQLQVNRNNALRKNRAA